MRLFFQAGYFEGMTELEKYKMYKKAQMMLAIKKLKAEGWMLYQSRGSWLEQPRQRIAPTSLV